MFNDADRCYRAMGARDDRFDGWFVAGVRTTGIYCRPSCPAMTPKRANVSFFPTAAAAQGAGFRACKRCRPDASPGSPEWNTRRDVVGRAMRMIADGVVDRHGVGGLAGALGYSERHLHRVLVAEVGAGAIALARAQRSQAARTLIETTDLPFVDVAFGAGFASLRQFNDTIRAVFASTPTELRARAGHRNRSAPTRSGGMIRLRVAVRLPFAIAPLLRFLSARAVPGSEQITAASYSRTLALPHGDAVIAVEGDSATFPGDLPIDQTSSVASLTLMLRLEDLRDLAAAVSRTRRLLDADADPIAVDDVLAADRHLRGCVRVNPGLRSVGSADPHEAALRAVLGQQVSVQGARTTARRISESFGRPCRVDGAGLAPEVSWVFPDVEVLAGAAPETLGVPRRRAEAFVGLAAAIASGRVRLDAGADRSECRARLLELPGIGAWTADYIVMRALGDPDILLASDLGVRHGAQRLGLELSALTERTDLSPWGSYVTHHLWLASGSHQDRGCHDAVSSAVAAAPDRS